MSICTVVFICSDTCFSRPVHAHLTCLYDSCDHDGEHVIIIKANKTKKNTTRCCCHCCVRSADVLLVLSSNVHCIYICLNVALVRAVNYRHSVCFSCGLFHASAGIHARQFCDALDILVYRLWRKCNATANHYEMTTTTTTATLRHIVRRAYVVLLFVVSAS